MPLNILQCTEQNSTIKNCPVQNVNNTCVLVAQSCPTLCNPRDYKLSRLHCPWNSPSKSNEVGSHFPLKGLFSIYGSNPGLLCCRWILYHLSHRGNPRLENPVLEHRLVIRCRSASRKSDAGEDTLRLQDVCWQHFQQLGSHLFLSRNTVVYHSICHG